jgi:hypothetical protein
MNDASCGLAGTCVQTMSSVPEGELLDMLNERNRVAMDLATKAHKSRGTDVHDEVWTAAVRVKWTPADERGAGTTKLDAIALDDVGNRMLLTDPLGIDAFSGGLSDGHHACRPERPRIVQ